jgi:hypothetical protein
MVHHTAGILLQRLIEEAVEVEVALGEADALHPAGDDDVGLARGDPIGRHGGGGQARAAIAVDGHAGRGVRESGPERRGAGDVVARGPFGQATAHEHILHLAPLDAGALYNGLEHMAGHRDPMGEVQRPARGFGDPRPAIADHCNVTHEGCPF